MAETAQKPTLVKMLSKKEVKKEVFDKLSGALAVYKNKFSKKKFENKLKKASNLFAVDIAKSAKKNKKRIVSKKAVEKK